VAAQRSDPDSLYHTIRKMVAVRRQNRVFSRGNLHFLEPEDKAVLAFIREWQGEQVLAVHNLAAEEQTTSLALAECAGARPSEMLSERPFPVVGTNPYGLTLKPHEYLWLRLTA
jgi:maltose alpha-D-glucosyltransferase / alpha-amylase